MKKSLKIIAIPVLLLSVSILFASCGEVAHLSPIDGETSYSSVYSASDGVTPDNARNATWAAYKTISNAAEIANGALVINSGDLPSDFSGYFTQDSEELISPTPDNPWIINISLKHDLSTSLDNSSSHSQITFNPKADHSNTLEIGLGEIFIRGSDNSKGVAAKRDTDNGFHDYTIVIYHDDLVEVYYDDESVPVLTGALVYQPGVPVRISFGDITDEASGMSHWQHVKHNARKDDLPDGAKVEYNQFYDASFGYLPTSICWNEYSKGNGNSFSLTNGTLIMNSGNVDRNFYFYYQDTNLVPLVDEPWIIEASLKYASGSTSDSTRRHTIISFTPTDSWMSNALQIGKDELFLNIDDFTAGPLATGIDTDDAFHTYRIEVYPDYTIKVYYDNGENPVLTGNLYYTSYMSTLRIYFGDGTAYSHGVSEWAYVKHNAATGECISDAMTTDGAFNYTFEAKSGMMPDDRLWKIHNTGSGNSSSIANGTLIMNSGNVDSNFYFYYQDTNLVPLVDEPWIIEASLKYASGSTSDSTRRHTIISFTSTDSWMSNALQIGKDEMFLNIDDFTAGTLATGIDTDDAFHTYRIEVYPDYTIKVYYDNGENPVLTGNLYYTSYMSTLRIYFGDGTAYSHGVSEWAYVKHNAYKW